MLNTKEELMSDMSTLRVSFKIMDVSWWIDEDHGSRFGLVYNLYENN